jgi:hypothetical protein
MRISALLLLAFILLGSAFGSDESTTNSNQQQSSIQSAAPGPFFTMRDLESARLRYLPGIEATCLKLRTYVVRRVDPHSDVTRLHSYRTCTPVWKFQTRSAVQGEKPAAELRLAY